MEPQFIQISEGFSINLAHVEGVYFHGRRVDDITNRQYADVYMSRGATYKCHEPYIADLKRAIADRTV